MKNISVVIIAINAGNYILNSYQKLKLFNEVLLIDDDSSDNTKEICAKLEIKYFKRKLNGDFAAQRNFALKNAKSDWILFLDTDEFLNDKFIKEVYSKIGENNITGYFLKRNDDFLCHQMSGTEMAKDKVLRLGKKGYGIWERKVHEIWKIDGPLGEIKEPILHKTAGTLTDFISKIQIYAKIHAMENIEEGKISSIFKIIFYSKAKFFNNFFLLRGYKDGCHGFVVSVLMSFHSFLSWSEIWLFQRKKL